MGTLSQVGIAGIANGILAPRHQNRFRVLFSGLGGAAGASAGIPNDLSMQVITCTLPNFSFEEVVQDRYNSRAYVLGKQSFDTCQMTIEDDVTNKAMNAIQVQLEQQQRLIGAAAGANWLNTPPTASGYKFGTLIELLDGNETVTSSWKLEGCMFTALDFGSLDASTGEKIMRNGLSLPGAVSVPRYSRTWSAFWSQT